MLWLVLVSWVGLGWAGRGGVGIDSAGLMELGGSLCIALHWVAFP